MRWLRRIAALLTLLGVGLPLHAQITVVSSSSVASSGKAYSVTVNRPSGVVAGDLLIALVVQDKRDQTIATPAGWTLVIEFDGSKEPYSVMFRRTATGAEAASYTFSSSKDEEMTAGITAFRGVDTSAPINASGTSPNSTSFNSVAPAISTTVANTLLLGGWGSQKGACTQPGGMTRAFQITSGSGNSAISSTLAYEQRAATGTTGTRTATCVDNEDSNGILIALTPVLPAQGGPIVFRASSSSLGDDNPANLVLAVPTGTLQNDVMIATVAVRNRLVSIAAPTGWTLASSVSQSTGNNGMKQSVYHRVAGASEPASYTWSFSGGELEHSAGGIVSFSNVDTASPIDTQDGQPAGNGSSYVFSTPTITPGSNGVMLLAILSNMNAESWTPPNGFTEAVDRRSPSSVASNGVTVAMAYRSQATAAAVSAAATAGSSHPADYGVAHLLALRPALGAPLAHWRMDESSWTGLAGEVIDSSGNGYHGTARTRTPGLAIPTAVSGTAAYSNGGQSTCNHGQFQSTAGVTRTQAYVDVAGMPALTGSFTVAAWFRPNGGGRVVVRDDIDNGWAISMGDPGANRLRFFSRRVSPTGSVTGSGTNNLCGTTFCLDSLAVVTTGQWNFVAMTIDTSARRITQYVFNSSGTLVGSGSSAYTGTWADGSGLLSIGGETASSPEIGHLTGQIDEVQFYAQALTQAQVQDLADNVRTCPITGPDHYELSMSTSSLACLATTVTVKACSNNSSPCTSNATDLNGRTATLATSGGTLGSTTVTFDATGVATTTLSHASAADSTSVSVTLSGEQTSATNARQCCANGTACSVANSCSTTFNTAGFIVAAAANGAAATVPAQTAGTASAGYFLRAVQTNTTTKACESAITGVGNVSWSYQCNNPSTCSASNLMTLTGNAATTIARNNNGSTASSTAVAMTFDANGNAPFTFNYADVGQVTLNASRAAGGTLLTTLTGATNAFVVRPGGFALSTIRQTAAPQLANPAAASGAGARFVRAGEAFSATVTATTSGGATTPNYGRETSPEGVLLTRALVLPAGGATGTLSNATIAGGSFSSGVATVTNLAFSEVGIITLTPSVGDGSYLGAGDTTGTVTGNIGRFFPAQFALSAGSVTHRSALSCSPASAFSYLGENFRLGLTLTAQNTAGATTTNYTGAFAKLDPTAVTWNLAGRDATTVFTVASTRLSLGSATGSFSNGVASGITLTANGARAASPDGPFNAAFGIAPVDSDGVAMAAFDMASASGGGNDRTQVASVPLRFGRLRLGSAAGAADRALVLPVAAQSWTGTAFDTNTLDSCTTIATTAMNFGNLRGTLTTADTAASGGVTLASGVGSLRLAAPGGGRSGTYDVALSLGSSATDASCLQPWTPGVGDVATAGANLAYLRGNFCASTYSNDPAARATFGRPRGVDSLVYRRENF